MYFPYKGIDLYYEKYGNGDETLVILPGWGDTRDSFTKLILTLQDYYTIYIVDYPGFSNTKFPPYDLTIYDYADMIHEWLESLELENPVLLGHSFGGRILITLTGYYQYSYEKIILMSSAGIRPKKTIRSRIRSKCYQFLKKIAKILPKKWRSSFSKKIFNYFSSLDYRVLPDKMKKTFQNVVSEDLKEYIEHIHSDTLIVWGEDDPSTPIQDAYYMNKMIQNSKLYILPNAGHFVYLERFQEVLEILVKFIEKDQ